MKKFIFALSLIVGALSAQAGPVSREEASQKAAVFLSSSAFSPDGSRLLAPARASKSLRAVEADFPFYVFNVGEDGGFILMSSDSRTPEVLGYADQGRFDADRLPDNMRAWFQSYADQLNWLASQPDEVAAKALRRAPAKVAVKNPISPLITTLWNQDKPYNQQCPLFLNGARCVTGCVATAVSQVMKFHQWPDSLAVNIPAYNVFQGYAGGPVLIDSVCAPVYFDWENMQDTYQGSEPQEQQDAVALLMATVGKALQADYHDDLNGGTSAYSFDIPRVLREYFDYSAQTHIEHRADYLMDEWNNLIYNELASRRPVIYSGQTSASGHSFIVDGYSSGGYFHVNWGWAGNGNGYFLLSVLNPYEDPNFRAGAGGSSVKEGYALSQDAVIGIKKNEGEAPFGPIQLEGGLVGIEGNTVFCSFNNNRCYDVDSFDIGLGLLRVDGTFVPIREQRVKLPSQRYYPSLPFEVNDLPDGTFKLLPVSKSIHSEAWATTLDPDRNYVRADVVERVITLTLVQPAPQLAATFDIQGTHRLGEEHTVRLSVENTGDEFNGQLFFFADTLGLTAPRGQVALVLPKDDRTQTSFSYTPVFDNIPADSSVAVHLAVATDKRGEALIADTLIVFAGGEPKVVVRSDSLDIRLDGDLAPLSDDGIYLLGDDARLTVRVTNTSDTTYVGNFSVKLYCISYPQRWTYSWTYSRYANGLTVPGHTMQEVSYVLNDVGNVDIPMGAEVYVELSYLKKNSWEVGYTSENHYVKAPALKKYKADGSLQVELAGDSCFVAADVVAVDLRQAEATKAVMGGNPNTLYYVNANVETLPEGLSANVIRGTVADSIVLRDGFDFAPPIAFTANKISYTRTFQRGFNRDSIGGWNSLVLPFAVTAVEVEEVVALEDSTVAVARPVDWYHSAADTDKDFWIMQFDDEEGRAMWFAPIDRFVAYRPYLIIVPEDTLSTNLVGKPMTFRGEQARITPSANLESTGHYFVFRGNRAYQHLEGIYALDADGAQFVKADTAVQAFRAFFAPIKSSFLQNLTIATSAQLDAIPALRPDHLAIPGDDQWYSLDGRRIAVPTRPGLYLHRGRKEIVK